MTQAQRSALRNRQESCANSILIQVLEMAINAHTVGDSVCTCLHLEKAHRSGHPLLLLYLVVHRQDRVQIQMASSPTHLHQEIKDCLSTGRISLKRTKRHSSAGSMTFSLLIENDCLRLLGIVPVLYHLKHPLQS